MPSDYLTTMSDLPDVGKLEGSVMVSTSPMYAPFESQEELRNKAMLEVKIENIELRKRLEKVEEVMAIIIKGSGK